MTTEADMVNKAPHYTALSPEPIDIIEAWQLSYHEGNALKYLARWKRKNGIEDLRKCRWYIDRLIEQNGV